MTKEPVLIISGAVGGLVSAVLTVIGVFGVDLTADQTAAIVGIPGAVAAVVLAVFARGRAVPLHRHEADMRAAGLQPAPPPEAIGRAPGDPPQEGLDQTPGEWPT